MRKLFFTLLAFACMTVTACGRQITTEGTATAANNTEAIETLIGSESAMESTESTEGLETIETMESSEATELSESTETPENQEEAIPEEAFDLSDVSPIEAFRRVLLNEAPFYCSHPSASRIKRIKFLL